MKRILYVSGFVAWGALAVISYFEPPPTWLVCMAFAFISIDQLLAAIKA